MVADHKDLHGYGAAVLQDEPHAQALLVRSRSVVALEREAVVVAAEELDRGGRQLAGRQRHDGCGAWGDLRVMARVGGRQGHDLPARRASQADTQRNVAQSRADLR